MAPYPLRGFALVEALIAALIVAAAVMGLAHLVTVSLAQSLRARQFNAALTLAQAKLEDLRGLAWHFDAGGARVSSAELAVSPPTALTENLDGWLDRLDRFGAPAPEDDTHYWRRWAVSTLDGADHDTLALQVCVFTRVRPGDTADACSWALRTRKP